MAPIVVGGAAFNSSHEANIFAVLTMTVGDVGGGTTPLFSSLRLYMFSYSLSPGAGGCVLLSLKTASPQEFPFSHDGNFRDLRGGTYPRLASADGFDKGTGTGASMWRRCTGGGSDGTPGQITRWTIFEWRLLPLLPFGSFLSNYVVH